MLFFYICTNLYKIDKIAVQKRIYLFTSHALHLLNDLSLLISGVEVGHITGVEYHTDVLHERLIFDLTVGKQEHRVLAFAAGFQQQLKHSLAW